MTRSQDFTRLFAVWELPAAYAAASGLFMPGLLMAARLRAPAPAHTSPR